MRAAVLQGNTVINVVELNHPGELPGAIVSDIANIGDTWNGQTFTKPPPPPVPVPVKCTKAQGRIALSRIDITVAMVDAVIEGMPDGQAKTEARIWWNDSQEYQRAHTAIGMLAPALGLTSQQVDDLFRTAATIY